MTKKLTFTAAEANLLGRTADALSAYMGKPVIAEIVAGEDFEWAMFAIPLKPEAEPEQGVYVQVGGAGSQVLGNSGGIDLSDGQALDCELLWAIQLTDMEQIRYIKVDASGEEIAWTENLSEMLPFDIQEPHEPSEEDIINDK